MLEVVNLKRNRLELKSESIENQLKSVSFTLRGFVEHAIITKKR